MHAVALSIREAAKVLSLGRSSVYILINEGKLDTVKIGRRRLVKVESLHRLLEIDA